MAPLRRLLFHPQSRIPRVEVLAKAAKMAAEVRMSEVKAGEAVQEVVLAMAAARARPEGEQPTGWRPVLG